MEETTVLFILYVGFFFYHGYQVQKLQMRINNVMSELRSMGKDYYNDKDYEPDYDNIK